MWQDIVIMVANFLFAIILLPQLQDIYHRKTSMNLYSTAITMFGLVVVAITFSTLEMWASMLASLINACIWTSLFWFSLRNRREGIIS
jgi:hypothetical protein